MKVKLLKKIRRALRDKITIYSTTTSTDWRGSCVTGMSYGYSDDCYKGLFSFGDTKEIVLRKVEIIGWEKLRDYYRKKYAKYSRLNRLRTSKNFKVFKKV